ncbi:MAG: iron-containing alcohol dehydrogenase [Coriobacteriia bacterium]|nr:iron-containing alcohol dehydrogenase [Coriobacteriia bacterium]
MPTPTSYRFGTGRYLHDQHILELTGSEVARYGTRALVVAGPTAWSATNGRVAASLDAAGIPYQLDLYAGFPSQRKVDELLAALNQGEREARDEIDARAATPAATPAPAADRPVVVAVGGGKIMDLCKAVAFAAGLPIVAIPTSAATCACFSPLSVMYTDEGKCVEYRHYDYELNAVLVDDAVMAAQPPRLLAAGIMDAMAKCIEIANGKPAITLEEDGIATYSAYRMAQDVYQVLEAHGMQACADLEHKRPTRTLHDVTFACIALTGIVSAIMRAKGQTAVAHRLYESLRTHYFRQTIDYLHGEIVATGLFAQLEYNRNPQAIEPLARFMRAAGMPLTLADLGLDPTDDVMEHLTSTICGTESVPDEPAARAALRTALEAIRC